MQIILIIIDYLGEVLYSILLHHYDDDDEEGQLLIVLDYQGVVEVVLGYLVHLLMVVLEQHDKDLGEGIIHNE